MQISDEAYVLSSIVVITIASFYRAATVNFREYQKDEDAFFPIHRRKMGKIERKLKLDMVVRERTIWECGGIFLNGIILIATIMIKKQSLGHTEFLFSNFFLWWYTFTVFQVLFWDLGVFMCIKTLILLKKERIKLPISPKDKSIFELEKDAEHFASIYDPIDDSNIYILNAYKPIYCLRDMGDYYRVAYFNEIRNDHRSIIIYLFDKNGQKLLYEEINKPALAKEQFLELKPGTLVSEVKEMDPQGIYNGFQKNSTDKRSLHITKDGYFIEIRYDYFSRITEVLFELI